jgi:hypothetical protein
MGKAPDQRSREKKSSPTNQMKREHAERIADIAARVEAWRAYRLKCMNEPIDVETFEEEQELLDAWKHEFGIPLSFYGCPFEETIESFDRWSKIFMKECVRHVTTGRPSHQFLTLLDFDQDLDFSWFLIGIPYGDLTREQSVAFLMTACGLDAKDAGRLGHDDDEEEETTLSSSSDVTPPLHPEPDLF